MRDKRKKIPKWWNGTMIFEVNKEFLTPRIKEKLAILKKTGIPIRYVEDVIFMWRILDDDPCSFPEDVFQVILDVTNEYEVFSCKVQW